MSEAVHAVPARTGERTIDSEHDVQLQLLDSLSRPCSSLKDYCRPTTSWTSSSSFLTCIFCQNNW